jgi:hypothetical protein
MLSKLIAIKLNKIPKTPQNIIILILVSLVIAIVTYVFFFSHQYPEIKNRSYFHCTENPSELGSYRLENFEIYDARVKENTNFYVTIVKFYEDREFLKPKVWYGAPTMSLFQGGSTASFGFETEKYLGFRIPVNGDAEPSDLFVLNRFDLTAQIITQSFLSKENKKLSYGNNNKLNDEIDELVKIIFDRNTKLAELWNIPVQSQCAKVQKPTKKI